MTEADGSAVCATEVSTTGGTGTTALSLRGAASAAIEAAASLPASVDSGGTPAMDEVVAAVLVAVESVAGDRKSVG